MHLGDCCCYFTSHPLNSNGKYIYCLILCPSVGAFHLLGLFVLSDGWSHGVAHVTSQTFVLAVLPRGGL